MNDGELDSIIRDDNVSIYILYVGSIPAGFAELDQENHQTIANVNFILPISDW